MKKISKGKMSQLVELVDEQKPEPLPTQQFGVSLQFIKVNNDGEIIPPLVRKCVEYLSLPDGNLKIHKFIFLLVTLALFLIQL